MFKVKGNCFYKFLDELMNIIMNLKKHDIKLFCLYYQITSHLYNYQY